MNLRSVQLFRTIVRLGSLKLAAERLGMSTSSASRMIGVLEHELKLKLFSRRNRKLDLTPEGQEFLQRSQHILEGLERLPDIAAQVRSVDADPLRLVSTLPLAIGIIAPVLALWQEHHPGVTSVLNIETRFDLESKVAAREYNLGIQSIGYCANFAEDGRLRSGTSVTAGQRETVYDLMFPVIGGSFTTAASILSGDVLRINAGEFA